MQATEYPIIRNQPVARFKYKGSHSKPVRREVVLTETRKDVFTGYETRVGNEVCDLEDADIRSFTRDKILDLARMSLKEAELILS